MNLAFRRLEDEAEGYARGGASSFKLGDDKEALPLLLHKLGLKLN